MQQQPQYITRGLVLASAALVIMLLASMIIKATVLQNVTTTKLDSAPALAGAVAQSLITNDTNTVELYGSDFTLKNTKYFSDKDWAVSRVVGTDQQTVTVVLKRVDGVYRVVVGPGSIFSGSITRNTPADVSSYLRKEGLLHG